MTFSARTRQDSDLQPARLFEARDRGVHGVLVPLDPVADQSDRREAVGAVRVHVRVKAEEHGTVHRLRRPTLGLEQVLPHMLEGRGLCLAAAGGPRHTSMLIECPAN